MDGRPSVGNQFMCKIKFTREKWKTVIGGKFLSLAVVYTVIQFMINTSACAEIFCQPICKNNAA
jgi:hypothetical protein